MEKLLRYWHTARYLRAEQLYGRVRRRLTRPFVNSAPPPSLRRLEGTWVPPAARRPSLVGPETLSLLNETHSLVDHGWDDESLSKLWRYNLHYFDDLNAEAASDRAHWHQELVARWIAENPPAVGSGWEPYPTSLRIVNWIKWALGGGTLSPLALHSLAVQTRWLERRLETHLLGNHLLANAKALTFSGLFFDGLEAERWLASGVELLGRQIREQILPDGGHFERSPMYHAIALEDMLDLCNVAAASGAAFPVQWRPLTRGWYERIDSMRDWLAAMSHPDAEIAFFNDAAIGIAPSPTELERYASRLGFPSLPAAELGIIDLFDTGYVRVTSAVAVAILDVAPVGPDYLPGHAHADTLSFELSLHGRRLFVNSGTSQYGASAERLRQRSTCAHNTVTIDGEDSSEVWGGFRVARRARPIGLEIHNGRPIRIRCAHDGYRRLPGRPIHTREWTFDDAALTVNDRISGYHGRAEARFHLHPAVRVLGEGGEGLLLRSGDDSTVRVTANGGKMRREPTTWHREFGRSEATTCLVVEITAGELSTRFDWSEP